MQAFKLHIVYGLLCLYKQLYTLQLPDILWDPENPIFNETLCGSDATKLYAVEYLDSLSIVCANRDLNNALLEHDKSRSAFFYNVLVTENVQLFRRRDFDINQVKILKYCRPKEGLIDRAVRRIVDSHRVYFNPYSFVASNQNFQAGKTYYFYTTSNGTEESLNSERRSPPHLRHMGFQVYICPSVGECSPLRNQISRCVSPTISAGQNLKGSDDQTGTHITIGSFVVAVLVALLCGTLFGLVLHRIFLTCEKKRGKKQVVDQSK